MKEIKIKIKITTTTDKQGHTDLEHPLDRKSKKISRD